MTEDERQRLAKKLECTPLYEGHGGESDLPEIAAAQLRADGERIKALEEALKAAGKAILAAPHPPLSLVDAPVLPPYGETLAQSLMDAYREAEAKMTSIEKTGFNQAVEDHARRVAEQEELKAAIALLMEPLGPEFEAAIYADLEGLYSNDQKSGGEGE